MLFHNCPACAPGGASRRGFLAGLGAAGLAATLPMPAVRAQGAKTWIDTHHHFYPPSYLAQQNEWEGARKIPPYASVTNWTPANDLEGPGPERHPQVAVLVRLHAGSVVRRRRAENAAKTVRVCQDYAAGMRRDHPDALRRCSRRCR